MSEGNYIVTVKCQHCQTIYMMVKYSKPAIGQVSNPNPGQPCPGCQKNTPAIVVAVAQER